MPSAIVLVNANFGSDEQVASRLREIQGVVRVSGVYDIVAFVKAGAMSELKTIIKEKIAKLDDARSVITMMVAGSNATVITA